MELAEGVSLFICSFVNVGCTLSCKPNYIPNSPRDHHRRAMSHGRNVSSTNPPLPSPSPLSIRTTFRERPFRISCVSSMLFPVLATAHTSRTGSCAWTWRRSRPSSVQKIRVATQMRSCPPWMCGSLDDLAVLPFDEQAPEGGVDAAQGVEGLGPVGDAM